MAFVAPAAQFLGGLIASEVADSAIKYVGKKAKKALKLKKGGKVPYNKKPRFFTVGGRVTKRRGMSTYQKTHDSVRAILMPGEIVIPKYYQKNKKKVQLAAQVEDFLRKKKVILPGM